MSVEDGKKRVMRSSTVKIYIIRGYTIIYLEVVCNMTRPNKIQITNISSLKIPRSFLVFGAHHNYNNPIHRQRESAET